MGRLMASGNLKKKGQKGRITNGGKKPAGGVGRGA